MISFDLKTMFPSRIQTPLSIKLKQSRDTRRNLPSFKALAERIALKRIESMNLHEESPARVGKAYMTAEELFRMPRRFRENRAVKKMAKYSLDAISSVRSNARSYKKATASIRKNPYLALPKGETSVLGKRSFDDTKINSYDRMADYRPKKYQRGTLSRSSVTCGFSWRPVTGEEVGDLCERFGAVRITRCADVSGEVHTSVEKERDLEVVAQSMPQDTTRVVGEEEESGERREILQLEEERYICVSLPLLSMLPWEVAVPTLGSIASCSVSLPYTYATLQTACEAKVEDRWFLSRDQEYHLSSSKSRLISALQGLPQVLGEGNPGMGIH